MTQFPQNENGTSWKKAFSTIFYFVFICRKWKIKKRNSEVYKTKSSKNKSNISNKSDKLPPIQNNPSESSVITFDPDYSRYPKEFEISTTGGTLGDHTSYYERTLDDSFARMDIEADDNKDFIIVYAPSGELGLDVDITRSGHRIISGMKQNSVMRGKLKVGDELVAIDGKLLSNMSDKQGNKMISQNRLRTFSVCRVLE